MARNARLREQRIVGSVSPYKSRYARLTPGIINTNADIDRALRAIRALRGS